MRNASTVAAMTVYLYSSPPSSADAPVTLWRQTVRCTRCQHSAWRELEVDHWQGHPAVTDTFVCTRCRCRIVDVRFERQLPKWSQAFAQGGLRVGLVTFAESLKIDAEDRDR